MKLEEAADTEGITAKLLLTSDDKQLPS